MLIFDQILEFIPEQSKTNVCLPFTLAEPARVLRIHTAYTPKYLPEAESQPAIEEALRLYVPVIYRAQIPSWREFLPLCNLVTLSLDYEDQYIGCAHRHAPEQEFHIAAEGSSPGFAAISPAEGSWRVVLNLHAIVTKSLSYYIHVETEAS